jgi:hypothetical protein
VVRALLDKGADPDVKNFRGETARKAASEYEAAFLRFEPGFTLRQHAEVKYLLAMASLQKTHNLIEALKKEAEVNAKPTPAAPQSPESATSVVPQPKSPSLKTTAPSVPVSVLDRVVLMFANHLDRMRVELSDKTTIEILAEVDSRFRENVRPISAMVEQTLSDRKLHTKFITGGGVRSWLLVSVVPTNRDNSAEFFGREYHPGYIGYMNFWLNSEPLRIARQIGHDIFAHVLVYADASSSESLSIGFGLFPLDQMRGTSVPTIIMPQESLTREDKSELGF